MEWNTETQRHRALFFERTEFTESFLIDYKKLWIIKKAAFLQWESGFFYIRAFKFSDKAYFQVYFEQNLNRL